MKGKSRHQPMSFRSWRADFDFNSQTLGGWAIGRRQPDLAGAFNAEKSFTRCE
jgi:hypothetical protein